VWILSRFIDRLAFASTFPAKLKRKGKELLVICARGVNLQKGRKGIAYKALVVQVTIC
jgi:hypothetical protein